MDDPVESWCNLDTKEMIQSKVGGTHLDDTKEMIIKYIQSPVIVKFKMSLKSFSILFKM